MKYYMGLDNGGTTTKAAIFDAKGTQISIASVSTKSIAEKPGFSERDMEEMWEANCQVMREAIAQAAIDPAEISSIAICGHGKGLYLWGKDGKPARNGIISTDNRAYEYPAQWEQDGTAEKVFALSCQHILACQAPPLLCWLRDHEPQVYENIAWVFEAKDYVRFRLTGEAQAEYTDYSGANLINLHTRQYDPELLQLFGLEDMYAALPPLVSATEICAQVSAEAAAQTGLKEGTAVAGGMFDIDACALGSGVTKEGQLCMIAGTWSINEYISKTPVLDGSILMNSFFADPAYYLIEESSPCSAGNLEWFIRRFEKELEAEATAGGASKYDVINAWVESVSADDFVPVFHPFLMGSNVHPNAMGSLIGLSQAHSLKHIFRAVYEGIVFCHRMHYEKLMQGGGPKDAVIRLAGGAAKSAVWAQMFADVMQVPVETVSSDETGALGCAIAGAAAVGDYPDVAAAADAMVEVTRRLEPNPAMKKTYDEKYALYTSIVKGLDELWPKTAAFMKEREDTK